MTSISNQSNINNETIFIYSRVDKSSIPVNLEMTVQCKRFSFEATALLKLQDTLLGRIAFSVPNDLSSDCAASISDVDSFHNDRYLGVGSQLILAAYKCSASLGRERELWASCLPEAVGFYAKIGFEINWIQYEDEETDQVSPRTHKRVSALFEETAKSATGTTNLYLKLTTAKAKELEAQMAAGFNKAKK